MSLRVYNTLSGEKEVFQPVHPGRVGIYLCGPTVYKSPHIGHMVGPVIFDAIKRYLRYKGFEVTWVVNITDVEDKLIDAANAAGRSVRDTAEQYTNEYFDCLKRLGVNSIDRFPKASEHIAEIIEMCQTLEQRGFAYAVEGNLYFDVTKDTDYGKLSHRKVEEQESGTRKLEGGGKRNPADFVLWKAAKPGEPTWESPWGAGRPGWHIECSAMSAKYLGKTFDIHGGGMDLMFPHHENELAQSESATGQPLARFWMHNGLTRLNTKKMSGSIGNVVAARSLIDEHGAELLRYMLLSTHYRRPIEFTPDVLTAASKGLATFHRLAERLTRAGQDMTAEGGQDIEAAGAELLQGANGGFVRDILTLKMKFLDMMDDDFNTAGAIGVLHEMASAINAFLDKANERGPAAAAGELSEPAKPVGNAQVAGAGAAAARTLRNLARLLGLLTSAAPAPSAAAGQETGLAPKLMELLIKIRAEARQSKNFALADSVRTGLEALGVTLEDLPSGTIWRMS